MHTRPCSKSRVAPALEIIRGPGKRGPLETLVRLIYKGIISS